MNVPSDASGPLPWPRWAYVPGETGGVDADYETLDLAKALVPRRSAATCRRAIRRCATGSRSTTAAISGNSQEVLEAVWAAAPQGGRERILLRACIHIANANLRLRMQRLHSAARLFGDAQAELRALNSRKAAAGGDGFVESFPIPALTALLQAKLGRPQLSKADWITLGAIVRSR
ncbi:DUF309 domain-containing protein [Bradyrhizobium japonicum]